MVADNLLSRMAAGEDPVDIHHHPPPEEERKDQKKDRHKGDRKDRKDKASGAALLTRTGFRFSVCMNGCFSVGFGKIDLLP